MKPVLNQIVDGLAVPPIPEVQEWARGYNGAVGPLIDLSQAVPGYPPPPELLNWLGEQASSPAMMGYGRIEGESVLRNAYANHVSQFYQARVLPEQTHITSGCNQAFIASAIAVAGAGDTVLMTNPRYFNHATTLSMLGINTAYVDCDPENSFLPDIETLREAVKTAKAFALVSPNNPTGSVYPSALLSEIFEVCQQAGTWLILDETYRDFMPVSQRHNLLRQRQWVDGLIQLYSFSKSFCIPGQRLGAIVAAEPVVAAIAKVMDNIQICAPRAVQAAIAQAIDPLADWRAENLQEIERRSAAMNRVFADLPRWKISSMGAYFAYVRHPFDGQNSAEIARELAQVAGISCLPGTYFGENQEAYLRLAFANVDVGTIEGLGARLKAFRGPA